MFDVFKVPAEVGIDVVEVVARLAVSVWSVDPWWQEPQPPLTAETT